MDVATYNGDYGALASAVAKVGENGIGLILMGICSAEFNSRPKMSL